MVANGYVPVADLVTVQGSMQLSRPTANAWFAMAAEGSRTGHRIGIAGPAGAYRSYPTQADMKKRPWLYNLSKQSSKKLAAAGHSTHGFGTAVDIVGDLNWAIANAHRWGFYREFGSADPNHFRHNGVTAITQTTSSAPLPGPRRKITMSILFYDKSTSKPYLYALAGDSPGTPANWQETTDDNLAASWAAQTGGRSDLTHEQWLKTKADYLAPLKTDAQLSVGDVAIDNASVVAAVEENTAALMSLPARIVAEQKLPGN